MITIPVGFFLTGERLKVSVDQNGQLVDFSSFSNKPAGVLMVCTGVTNDPVYVNLTPEILDLDAESIPLSPGDSIAILNASYSGNVTVNSGEVGKSNTMMIYALQKVQ